MVAAVRRAVAETVTVAVENNEGADAEGRFALRVARSGDDEALLVARALPAA